ncbi:MAG: hypothetical protein ACK58H_05685 [Planctomyces sp.]|jgi:hypothetical protein
MCWPVQQPAPAQADEKSTKAEASARPTLFDLQIEFEIAKSAGGGRYRSPLASGPASLVFQ